MASPFRDFTVTVNWKGYTLVANKLTLPREIMDAKATIAVNAALVNTATYKISSITPPFVLNKKRHNHVSKDWYF